MGIQIFKSTPQPARQKASPYYQGHSKNIQNPYYNPPDKALFILNTNAVNMGADIFTGRRPGFPWLPALGNHGRLKASPGGYICTHIHLTA